MSLTPTTGRRPPRRPRLPGAWSAPRLRGTGLLLAAALAAASARGAPASHGGDPFDLAHPAVRAFSDRDGLPQNTVHSIAKDRFGYLWVGTQDGAARWNGREWLTIDMPDRDVSNYVRSLVPARDGGLWFAREAGGVVRLRPDALSLVPRREAFTVFGTAQGLPALRVTWTCEASDGTLWVATAGGAARLARERFGAVNDGLADPRLWVVSEIEDDANRKRIAAGGEGGLFLLDGSHWSPVDLGPRAVVGSVNSLLQTKDAAGVHT